LRKIRVSSTDKVVVVVHTLGGRDNVVFIPTRQQRLHLMVSLSVMRLRGENERKASMPTMRQRGCPSLWL